MTLTSLQQKALGLFNSKNFAGLVEFLKENGASEPLQVRPDESRLGQFGCRVSPTQWAVEDDHNLVFTVDLDGQLTLNLHGSLPQSVDWTNGTMSCPWIFKDSLPPLEADKLVMSAWYSEDKK
jgi:hypothetical protein